MRKLILLVVLLCATSSTILAQDTFQFYWPWIKSHIASNDAITSNAVTLIVRGASTTGTGYVLRTGLHTYEISFPTNTAFYGSNAWAWITSTGFQAAVNASFSTNWIATTGTTLVVFSQQPRTGIWGMDGNGHLGLLPQVLQTQAGFWKMNTNANIVISSNWWYDVWWETNSLGNIVMRDLP